MTVNDERWPDMGTQPDYDTLTRQTEMFIRECLAHAENESEPAPDEWLENAWTALEVWYTLTEERCADKSTRDVGYQRFQMLITHVEREER
ncbi:hypothetical protein DSP73_21205 [Salmonella enterica]|nr:hypothetical protein [Salmonella enterica]ECN5820946.1 hypothetical protein [Salmonella enterica subsp. enterica serovar Infantis]EDW6859306.1 hypothetical protein [Salmonella enterica]EEJ5734870.1 hypothetical protein [Salmonella enterica]